MEKTIETLTPSTDVSSLVQSLFADARRLTGLGLLSDESYVLSRLNLEGDKFALTILPKLGRAVETSFIRCEPLATPVGLALYGKTRLPRFLFPLMQKCFSEEGRPLSNPDLISLEVIRQITLFFSKVNSGSLGDVSGPISEFLDRVKSCKPVRLNVPELIRARQLCHQIFSNKCLDEWQLSPWGHHGPGAVSEGECGVEKWQFTEYPGLDASLFDLSVGENMIQYSADKPVARVLAVPKDFRGPRIICAEPKECMFGQQGLKEIMYNLLQSHYLTRNSIDFEDVSRNRAACFQKKYATLDLKDASDRLSIGLVRFLFPRKVFQLLTQYRSRALRWNDRNYSYRAFATMGSALCFPVQTLVFFTIVKATQQMFNRVSSPAKMIRSKIFVFGDDIICDMRIAPRVIEVLELAGLKVNLDKTPTATSIVRESCGEWVVGSTSQIIVKPKTISSQTLAGQIALAETSRLLNDRSWFATAISCAELGRCGTQPYPTRWNRELQRKEELRPVLVATGRKVSLQGVPGLYNWYTQPRPDGGRTGLPGMLQPWDEDRREQVVPFMGLRDGNGKKPTLFLNRALVRAKKRWVDPFYQEEFLGMME
jgi:hypothetical protein